MAGRSWADKPKRSARNPLRVRPKRNLYYLELMGRALDKVDAIRESSARPGRNDGKTQYTVGKLAAAVGIHPEMLRRYLYRRCVIPPAKLDLLLAAVDLDILDLLSPSDVAEAYDRQGKSFRHFVERAIKADVGELPSASYNKSRNPKISLDTELQPQ